jgi:site-specific DNA-methyltransferase (adenine-specific)
MDIELVNIDDLDLDPRNARKHDAKNLKAIADSLEQFGQRKPIVVWGKTVVAGNGTMAAARTLGWTDIQVVYIPSDWSSDQVKAYALADNRSAELAAWDEQVLASQLLELQEAEFDIELLGFELPVDELQDVVEDEIPEQVEPKSKLGQVWQLGKHRLVCGDATDTATVQNLMAGNKADLIWTDPPYGVAIAQSTSAKDRDVRKLRTDGLTVMNDDLNPEQLVAFLTKVFQEFIAVSKPGCVWYVAAPSGNPFYAFAKPLFELGVWKHTIAWVKDVFVLGRADYHYRHESIFYGWTPGAGHKQVEDRTQDSVWEIPRPKQSKEHPTMKPIELITRAIENSSNRKDFVLDLFGGSGSTLIACEQTDRICFMMELDPKYVDVIIARWEKLTGLTAELITD